MSPKCPSCGHEPPPPTCYFCRKGIPAGQGIGFSVPEERWLDRSKSRPLLLIPACTGCTVNPDEQKLKAIKKKMGIEPVDESQDTNDERK